MPNGTNNKNVRQVRHRQGGGDSLPSQTKEEHIEEIVDWDLRRWYGIHKDRLQKLREKKPVDRRAFKRLTPYWWDEYSKGPFDPDLSFAEYSRAFKDVEKRREFEREFGPPMQHAVTGKPFEINKGGVIPRKPRKPRKVSKVSKVRKGGAIKRTSRKISTVRKGGAIKRRKK